MIQSMNGLSLKCNIMSLFFPFPFLSQEQLAKLAKAYLPLMASPNVGLIGPGQDVVFELILPDRNIWPVSREATIGKMGYFRILQMQVTDPWEVLSAFSGNNTSLTRGIKQLFDALNTARSCEDALERIYSCDVPFFFPPYPIILSEENLNVGAKNKVKKDEQNGIHISLMYFLFCIGCLLCKSYKSAFVPD
uniref:Uncharacterized protein n=1 Tax=Meloidogyne enterolobii TaxID=390850 RepID=A0A6V7UF91_MELEN|nr:unnamed protein product [Meloidogyne enterolobii]